MDEKYTRCPGCRTVFRVTPAQLALREGQVRCGHCRTVFDGTANLIQLARSPAFAGDDDASATGPLTVTLRSAAALEPVAPAAATGEAVAQPAAAAPPVPARPPARKETEEPVDYDHRFAWDRPRKRSRRVWALYIAATLVLALVFAGQLVGQYRDAVAAHWPASRPMLLRACALAGCEVRPLREIAGLSIDASDLQADPAHRGLLVLTATLRNRAGYAVAYPHLELTLTDGQDNVVVRRALAPNEYVGGTADVGAGIPGNGEVAVKLFIDASATTQSGYRVYLFYP
jgi:predicted Zn finger-like uncharacterized protein